MGKSNKRQSIDKSEGTPKKNDEQPKAAKQTPEKVSTPTDKKSKSKSNPVTPEPSPKATPNTNSNKKQKKEKVEQEPKVETTEQPSSLADFFASKNAEQNDSLFSAFSQIKPAAAPQMDVKQAVAQEKKKIDNENKLAELDEKHEAAEIEKQIDAEIKEHEKAEKFLTSEQKDERDKRSIFVGNVTTALEPKKLTKELKALFGKYGAIEAIRFRSIAFAKLGNNKVNWIKQDLHKKRDSLNAYLVFQNVDSVEKALAENGALFLGKHIRVDYATHDPKREKFTTFVGNLAYDCSEETLRTFFADCGGITNVHIVREKGGIGKGVAFVSFEDNDGLKSALAKDGTKFGTRPVRVCRPSPKDKTKRDENKQKQNPKDKTNNNNNNKRKQSEQKANKTSKKVKTSRFNADGTPSWQGRKAIEGQSTQVVRKINKQTQFAKKKKEN